MNKFLGIVLIASLSLAACGDEDTDNPPTNNEDPEPSPEPAPAPEPEPEPEPEPDPEPEAQTVTLSNEGGGMEGHTPRGFMGTGTGLFTGDNLNPRFPEGDGVQLFLSFDLADLPIATIESAILKSDHASTTGSPFADLGELMAQEVRYDTFSPALQALEPEVDGASCVFATSKDGPFECDLTALVQRSIDDGRPFAQMRLRMEEAGDNDGAQDLVLFFITDSNTNEPGIFELTITGH